MLSIDGQCQNSIKPSKELPLHMCLYKKSDTIQAVIHTHSFYATLWSCYKHENAENVIPSVTPYLNMKVGKIALIPYAPPGSSELFSLMEDRAHLANGFLLKNHGPLVGGKTIMDAFLVSKSWRKAHGPPVPCAVSSVMPMIPYKAVYLTAPPPISPH